VPEHPFLDSCSDEEKAAVLTAVLSLHPDTVADAERVARAVLDNVDADEIADEVTDAIDALSPGDLGAGPRADGFVESDEAVDELIQEVIGPYLAAFRRRVDAGLDAAAATVALGVLKGLYAYRDIEGHELLAAAPECVVQAADQVEALLAKAGIEIDPEDYAAHVPDWAQD